MDQDKRNHLNQDANVQFGDLPIGKNEDVEFSEDQMDADDKEALERAEQADQRQQS